MVLADLRPRLPRNTPVFCSPLTRCRNFGLQLAEMLDAPAFNIDARLQEMHFGKWEMRAWDDISKAEIDAWVADLDGYRPGGGESTSEVALRVHAFLCILRENQSGEIIVVTPVSYTHLTLPTKRIV